MQSSSKVTQGLRLSWRTSLPLCGRDHKSSLFSFLDAQWKLNLRYTGFDYEITLQKMTAHDDSHHFEVTTCTEHDRTEGEVTSCQRATVTSELSLIWIIHESSVQKKIPELKKSGGFTVVCTFHAVFPDGMKREATQEPGKEALEFPTDLCGLSFDLGKLLKEGVMTDVEFKCEGKTVPAHRAVLAARSAVFSDRIRKNKDESRTCMIDVPDLDIDALQLLLKYAYCGKIDVVRQRVIPKLYRAADKYAVVGLEKACSYWMKRNLTVDNFIAFLLVAKERSNKRLEDEIMRFISKHDNVRNSEAWKNYVKEHPSKEHQEHV